MFTLLRLIFLPAKVGVGSTKLGMKAGYRTGRLLGYRRIFVFAVGVGVGLLIAPMTGREARAKLQRLIDERRGTTGGDLAEVFVEDKASSNAVFDDGKVEHLTSGRDRGAGIRVIVALAEFFVEPPLWSSIRKFDACPTALECACAACGSSTP